MKRLAPVLIAVGCLLLLPATASAVPYEVNSLLDAPDDNVGAGDCHTAANECTLRAAIQESNSSTAVDDTIVFAASFDGKLADTIAIGASFPAITDKVHIDGDAGGQCTTGASGVLGPCAGVEKTGGGLGLVVENADGVTIDGLALTGATYGIGVFNSSASFTARDNWLGVKLDGNAGANNTGVFIDPDSNGATIGGKAAADRNVFANSGFEGLDIEGADNADVLGNYFGVKPDGVTVAANGKNVEITDTIALRSERQRGWGDDRSTWNRRLRRRLQRDRRRWPLDRHRPGR